MSAVLEVRKQTALLSQGSLRDFVKIPNEWTASVRRRGIYRSGPAIFSRGEKISALHTENIVASSLFSSNRNLE